MSGKPTDLVVYGFYRIGYEDQGNGRAKHITKENARAFWDQPEVSSVAGKQGCYVFALKASKGYTPWYVGKATKTFKQEALSPTKRNLYNEVLFAGRKGTPVLFFVARPDNLVKIPTKHIADLETFLIQSAYFKNRDLTNTHHKKDPSWAIRGVIRGGKGKVAKNAQEFRVMMDL
jgi:hypothetical protein